MPRYKLKLIQPHGVGRMKLNPPMALLILSAMTPEDFEVTISDEHVAPLDFGPADIVGISVHTPTADRAYEIADAYRSKGAKVILGGVHVTYSAREAAQHADAVVLGEAENTWQTVLSDFARGGLKPFYESEKPDLQQSPVLDWRYSEKKGYVNKYSIQTSRGCPYGCDFCGVSAFNGKKLRHKPVENVLRELEHIKRSSKSASPLVHFLDDNVGVDKAYSKELFKAMVPLGIRWRGEMSVSTAQDGELLDLAAASGCRWLRVGLESVSQDALKEMHKPFKVADYTRAIENIQGRGMVMQASFVFGFDSDADDVFDRTIEFCRQSRIDFGMFHPLNALPGTVLYERVVKEGRTITERFKLKPKNMSYAELERRVVGAAQRFYSLPLIYERTKRFIGRKLRAKGAAAYPLARYMALNLVWRAGFRRPLSVPGAKHLSPA
jgi:radical SAM superfamily enzyme YgiQ (UPF0313 family)